MLTILAFIVVLGPLILLHELGHFVGAKLTGVRVEEFGLGWPPRLTKIWQSPSKLIVGATSVVAPRNFRLPSSLTVGQHVEAIARRDSDGVFTLRRMRVLDPDTDDITAINTPLGEEVQIRGPLMDMDLGTAYTVNWIPLGGFCRMTGEEDPGDPRSLAAQPKRERLLVLFAGPVTNLVVAIVLFTLAFYIGIPEPINTRVTIRGVSEGTPAAEAGLQAGDVVLRVNDVAVENTSELIETINAHAGQTVVLTLEREGSVIEESVWVRSERWPEGRVGINISDKGTSFITHRSTLPDALGQGLDQFWFSVEQIVLLPAKLIQGQVTAQEVKPVGPLGISQMAGSVIERSAEEKSLFSVLFFAGAISMALGITNLLPLPALDGGRILFVLIEAVRGRRVDPAKEGLVHLIGMAVLLGLMLLMTIQELLNPVMSPF